MMHTVSPSKAEIDNLLDRVKVLQEVGFEDHSEASDYARQIHPKVNELLSYIKELEAKCNAVYEIGVELSEPSPTKLTQIERVVINGVVWHVLPNSHISSRYVCIHLNHPTISKIIFKQ